jgi:hypothetical protein
VNRISRAARGLASPAFAAPASIALLALLASSASIVNGFVFDDRPIVEFNSRVHTLARWWEAFGQAYWPPHWGNTNYRPLTILSFAVQWAIGDGSPIVFHGVSIALYVAACLAVLSLARLVLPAMAAWAVAALFAVHPVHVEAVANVVGQSELLVALSSVLATTAYVRLRTAPRVPTEAGCVAVGGPAGLPLPRIAAIGALYGTACFSKETGFLLPALLIAAELTVVTTQLEAARRTLLARARELRTLYAVCAAIGFGYLLVRRSVLGGFGDLPSIVLARLSNEQRLLTMLGVVPEWVRLLVWPSQLSADYSPPRITLILSPTTAVIPGVIIVLGVVVLAIAGWRTRRRVTTFGLLWLAVTIFPVSNVILRSGVILAERTLFLPSVGALLAIGAMSAWTGERIATLRRPLPLTVAAPIAVAVAIVLSLGAVKSATRAGVWRNSDVFFAQIVEDAPLGYRAHHLHGVWLFDTGRRAEGERHLRAAIAMFPYDAGPYTDLADRYRQAGLCSPARDLYQKVIELGMLRDRARLGLVVCLLRDAHYAEAAAEARIGASAGGFQVEQFRRLAAIADSAAAATTVVHQSGAPRRARAIGNAP